MNASNTVHHVGATEPLNAGKSVTINLPYPAINLGLLCHDEPLVWQFDPDVGLPVVAKADYFGEMLGRYGNPDHRRIDDRTGTVPIEFTSLGKNVGNSMVNFSRNDELGFFAPESIIWSDFPRLYVGTVDDYNRLVTSTNSFQIEWGDTFTCGGFTYDGDASLRSVTVVAPDGQTVHKTRPASEGLVQAPNLIETSQLSQSGTRFPADDD